MTQRELVVLTSRLVQMATEFDIAAHNMDAHASATVPSSPEEWSAELKEIVNDLLELIDNRKDIHVDEEE